MDHLRAALAPVAFEGWNERPMRAAVTHLRRALRAGAEPLLSSSLLLGLMPGRIRGLAPSGRAAFSCSRKAHTQVAAAAVPPRYSEAHAARSVSAEENATFLPTYTHRSPIGTIAASQDRSAQKPPRVVYLVTAEDTDDVLTRTLRPMRTANETVGLDLEWNVGVRQGKTALVQLCTADTIYVIQIACMQDVPRSVRRILEDNSIRKVGVAVQNDAHKLYRDFQITTGGLVELSSLAKALDISRWPKRRHLISLRNLTEQYLERELRKDKVRVSSWTTVPLAPQQLEYAAADVYVGLELFHAFVLRAREAGANNIDELVRQCVQAAQLKVPKASKRAPPSAPRESRQDERVALSPGGLSARRRVLEAFATAKHDFSTIAEERKIPIASVASYVIQALMELARARDIRASVVRADSTLRARLRTELVRRQLAAVRDYYGWWLIKHGVFTRTELQALAV